MNSSPAASQPLKLIDLSEAIKALDDFTRTFIMTGTRAEFNRSARMLLPFVNGNAYEYKFVDCDCEDLELWYVPDPERRAGYFYTLCHEHRLQPIGRATRCSRNTSDGERTHRRRKSGYTTFRSRWL